MEKTKIYDSYWKLTLHNTNFFGTKFIDGLKILSIRKKNKDFKEQQLFFRNELKLKINDISIRKWINQYTKLGLAYKDNNNCVILNPISYKIIKEERIKLRKIYLSEAFYEASFNQNNIKNIKF
ncbi:hypothetical protein [Spiroplasma endosymbiont of Nebria brevicollis]|uniref:hypothetical protein n=1 Tax=Spiroplasma endosymbiont of Nebria brevicollis TaxID=3066284 RepID=UPI00313E9EC9